MVEAMDETARTLGRDPIRSVAQLNMLHSLTAKLNSLDEVEEIGAAITAELRTIIDYHNCRVYVLQADGTDADARRVPRRDLHRVRARDDREPLTHVGEGITGWVAEHRTSVLAPDARESTSPSQIPGTDDILESMLAVPMTVGETVHGVIVLSSLGLRCIRRGGPASPRGARVARCDRDLQREALPGRARGGGDLVGAPADSRSRSPSSRPSATSCREAIETVSSLIDAAAVAFHVRDEHTGDFRLARLLTLDPDAHPTVARDRATSPSRSRPRSCSTTTSPSSSRAIPRQQVTADISCRRSHARSLIAPVTWEPDGFGAIAVIGHEGDGTLRRARPPTDPRHRRHHVARARQREAHVRARAVP